MDKVTPATGQTGKPFDFRSGKAGHKTQQSHRQPQTSENNTNINPLSSGINSLLNDTVDGPRPKHRHVHRVVQRRIKGYGIYHDTPTSQEIR